MAMNFRAVFVGALGAALLAGSANASLINAPFRRTLTSFSMALIGLGQPLSPPMAVSGVAALICHTKASLGGGCRPQPS
jgi:hypothetical protein